MVDVEALAGTLPACETDAQARAVLAPEVYARFARPCVWRWLSAVALEWAIIGGVVAACNRWPYPLLWVAGIFLIGTRQHALGILAHESVHALVCRKRRLNDLLGNLFCAYPLTYPVQGYRTFHILHHSFLDTPDDPERASIDLYPREWVFPMSRLRWYGLLLRDMTGIYQFPILSLIRYIWQVPGGNLKHAARIVIYHAAIATVAFLTGYSWSYLLLWLLPLYTVAIMCFRIRTAAEHSSLHPDEKRFQRSRMNTMDTTRTTVGGWVGGFLFAPYNMSYHIEHHLFPTVPVFRLRALHHHLMQIPQYAQRARLSYGFPAMFGELTSKSAQGQSISVKDEPKDVPQETSDRISAYASGERRP
jgi:fatty acid desaturase